MLKKQWLDLRCGHVGYVGGGEWGGVCLYMVCVVWYGVCSVFMCIWHDMCTLVYMGCGGVFVCDVYVCECEHGMVCVYAV